MRGTVFAMLLLCLLFLASCAATSEDNERWSVNSFTYYVDETDGTPSPPEVIDNRRADLAAEINHWRVINKKEPIPVEDFETGKWLDYYPEMREELD